MDTEKEEVELCIALACFARRCAQLLWPRLSGRASESPVGISSLGEWASGPFSSSRRRSLSLASG